MVGKPDNVDANGFRSTSTSNGNGDNGSGAASGDGDIDTGIARAWGHFARFGNTSEATRSFNFGDGTLPVNATLSLSLDIGFIDTGGVVGLGLRNASNQNLVEIFFRGGDGNFTVFTDNGGSYSGTTPGFSDEGFNIDFTLTGSGHVRPLLHRARHRHR